MLNFIALAAQCAPTVAPQTMAAIVSVESSFNPYAIGVVNGHLTRQPKNLDEAVATANALESQGWNYSVGITQVNRVNIPKDVTLAQVFDACTNLKIGSKILEKCFTRASSQMNNPEQALQAAFSCYYSGNFTVGFMPDSPGKPSYVQKVLASADTSQAIPVVPDIKPKSNRPKITSKTEDQAPEPTPAQQLNDQPVNDNPVLLPHSKPNNKKTELDRSSAFVF